MGDAQGCFNLGGQLLEGQGVGKNVARAVTLFTKACDGGFAGGCGVLGMLFEGDLYARKDAARAARAYARGCALGDPESCAKVRTPESR